MRKELSIVRELSVTFTVQVSDRAAAKFSALSHQPVSPGPREVTARVVLRPVEQLLLDTGVITEDALRATYREAIEAGDKIAYHY